MSLENRIAAFDQLGTFLGQFTREKIEKKESIPFNDLFFDTFVSRIKNAKNINGWFTQDNILFSFENWSKLLETKNLEKWIRTYDLSNSHVRNIGVIMAGNIPLVGFHDFLSVLITGHKITAKQSSNDSYFLPLIAKYLEHIEPEFVGKIKFSDKELLNFDAVIATGSNNTARYFDYYFSKYPNIIRQNRNAVAVLNGNESPDDLKNLGEDIFRYFGLGCRSVSKIFVPKDYDFDLVFKNIYDFHEILHYQKYENNYTYNKAVYLMSEFKLLENGFLMFKKDESYGSPIATVFYEYFDDLNAIQQKLELDKDQIQCVVSNQGFPNEIAFGETQIPQLWDYADGVDTIQFLINL